MADDMEERIIIVPLRKVYDVPRTKRSQRAIKIIRSHIARHMKMDEDTIWLDSPVNEEIWKNGRENPPKKIRLKATMFKDENLVEVTIPEE